MPMTRYQLYPGMLVIHSGTTARVEKINPKKIIVTHEDGRRWNTYAEYLSPAPEGTTFNLDEVEQLHIGNVVEWMGEPEKGKFVVMKQKTAHSYAIVKLGGDNGRYYPDVPASRLLKVEVPEGLR